MITWLISIVGALVVDALDETGDLSSERLFHGTSMRRLRLLLEAGVGEELYLADVEDKAWDYAERAAIADGDQLVVLTLLRSRLRGTLRADVGSGPLEWEHDMGQWIYTGSVEGAVAQVAYLDEDGSLRSLLSDRGSLE